MSPSPLEEMRADVLIVGAGLAGLFAALKLAPRPVTVLSVAPIGEASSSAWAQGGIAAAVGTGDSAEAHAVDTEKAGGGLVDAAVIRGMTAEAADRVEDLRQFGVHFDLDEKGNFSLGLEAAHSHRRIVRVSGDRAGAAVMQALEEAVARAPSIRFVSGYAAVDLLMAGGRVAGVRARSVEGAAGLDIHATTVVLASGGIGHLYAVTTNPPAANGDGLAMAARAGALIADPEFVQFHPTAISGGGDPAPLATEALRGAGAILVNEHGERFMKAVHEDAELAPRDIVARAIFAERRAGRRTFLDATKAVGTRFPDAFPTVFGHCQRLGLDPRVQPIPVEPAAHYHMGGIQVDGSGATSVERLHACGEVASTGAHGANRLASNSLLEAIVWAGRIAETIGPPVSAGDEGSPTAPELSLSKAEPEMVSMLRRLMTEQAGVVRDADGLASARDALLAMLGDAKTLALANRVTASLLIVTAALNREESRGGHYRRDFPHPAPAWAHRTVMTLADVLEPAEAPKRATQ